MELEEIFHVDLGQVGLGKGRIRHRSGVREYWKRRLKLWNIWRVMSKLPRIYEGEPSNNS